MHDTKLHENMDRLVYGIWNGLARAVTNQMHIRVKRHVWADCRAPVRDLIYGQVLALIMAQLQDDIGHAYEGGRPGPVLDNVARGTFVELVSDESPALIIWYTRKHKIKHIRMGTQGQVHGRSWNEDKGIYEYVVKFEGHSGLRSVEESALKRVV